MVSDISKQLILKANFSRKARSCKERFIALLKMVYTLNNVTLMNIRSFKDKTLKKKKSVTC